MDSIHGTGIVVVTSSFQIAICEVCNVFTKTQYSDKMVFKRHLPHFTKHSNIRWQPKPQERLYNNLNAA
jgi:hypothetical protein